MDWLLQFQPPLSLVGLTILAATLILIRVHVRMLPWARWCIVIPAVGVCAIYLMFDFGGSVSIEVRSFFGRWGLEGLFIWYIILLLATRKRHIPA